MRKDYADYFIALAALGGAGTFVMLSFTVAIAAFRPEAFGKRLRNVTQTILCFFVVSSQLFIGTMTAIAALLPSDSAQVNVRPFEISETVYVCAVVSAMLLFGVGAARAGDWRKALFGFVGAFFLCTLIKPMWRANEDYLFAAGFIPIVLGLSITTASIIVSLAGLIPFVKARSLTVLLGQQHTAES